MREMQLWPLGFALGVSLLLISIFALPFAYALSKQEEGELFLRTPSVVALGESEPRSGLYTC